MRKMWAGRWCGSSETKLSTLKIRTPRSHQKTITSRSSFEVISLNAEIPGHGCLAIHEIQRDNEGKFFSLGEDQGMGTADMQGRFAGTLPVAPPTNTEVKVAKKVLRSFGIAHSGELAGICSLLRNRNLTIILAIFIGKNALLFWMVSNGRAKDGDSPPSYVRSRIVFYSIPTRRIRAWTFSAAEHEQLSERHSRRLTRRIPLRKAP